MEERQNAKFEDAAKKVQEQLIREFQIAVMSNIVELFAPLMGANDIKNEKK